MVSFDPLNGKMSTSNCVYLSARMRHFILTVTKAICISVSMREELVEKMRMKELAVMRSENSY